MFNKNLIYYATGVFMFICIAIVLLLNIYYLTPNNYQILNYSNTKFKIINEQKIIIKPSEKYLINQKKLSYVLFDKDTNLIISNFLKSENIIVEKLNVLQIKFGSDITIINPSKSDLTVKIRYIEEEIINV